MSLLCAYAFVGLGFLLCDLARVISGVRSAVARRNLRGMGALATWCGVGVSALFFGVLWPVYLALKLRIVFAPAQVVGTSEKGGDS